MKSKALVSSLASLCFVRWGGWRWTIALALLLIQACATPTGRLIELASELELERSSIKAAGFKMLVLDNINSTFTLEGFDDLEDGVMHVYLEGDGSPWKHRTIIMHDPTPRNPLMLRLMSYDRAPSFYLGRPCYNGYFSDPDCNNSLWTSARYSEKVVRSMAIAIKAMAKRHNVQQLWLFGHSGGGALAMLLADRLPQVTRVVTLAGNLDTDAWTRHHQYTPLYSSFNPATSSTLRDSVWQWHLIGGSDVNIPSQLLRPVIMAQPAASGFEFPGFSHGCCWERIWPGILSALHQDDPSRIPGMQFKFRNSQSAN